MGAKADLYGLMRDLAEEGQTCIIFISSDLDELLKCASRVITVYNGQIAGEFNTEDSNKTEIVASMIGERAAGNEETLS